MINTIDLAKCRSRAPKINVLFGHMEQMTR